MHKDTHTMIYMHSGRNICIFLNFSINLSTLLRSGKTTNNKIRFSFSVHKKGVHKFLIKRRNLNLL